MLLDTDLASDGNEVYYAVQSPYGSYIAMGTKGTICQATDGYKMQALTYNTFNSRFYYSDIGIISYTNGLCMTGYTPLIGNGSQAVIDGNLTTARVFLPMGITFDGAGNMYFTDQNLVRVYNVSSGLVTTIAGNSNAGTIDGVGLNAGFNNAYGIAYDLLRKVLYIAERSGSNSTIRRMTLP